MRSSYWSSDVCSSDLHGFSDYSTRHAHQVDGPSTWTDQAVCFYPGHVPFISVGVAGIHGWPVGQSPRVPDTLVGDLGFGGLVPDACRYTVAASDKAAGPGAFASHAGPVCFFLYLPACSGLGLLGTECVACFNVARHRRSDEHTSELQSLMRIS